MTPSSSSDTPRSLERRIDARNLRRRMRASCRCLGAGSPCVRRSTSRPRRCRRTCPPSGRPTGRGCFEAFADMQNETRRRTNRPARRRGKRQGRSCLETLRRRNASVPATAPQAPTRLPTPTTHPAPSSTAGTSISTDPRASRRRPGGHPNSLRSQGRPSRGAPSLPAACRKPYFTQRAENREARAPFRRFDALHQWR